MSKIVNAVNAMVSNNDKIGTLMQNGKELFFLYDNKYKWSINHDNKKDNYTIFYYPGDEKLEFLASLDSSEWQSFDNFVKYSAKDLKIKKATESFRELYQIVLEKVYGINEVLDDIITGDNK